MSENLIKPINNNKNKMNGNLKYIVTIIVTIVIAFSALTWGIIESAGNKTMDIWVEQVKQNTQDVRKIDVILTEIRVLKEAFLKLENKLDD